MTTAGDGDVRLVDLLRGFQDTPPVHRPRRAMLLSNAHNDSAATKSLFGGDDTESGMGMKVRFVPGSHAVFLTTHQAGAGRRAINAGTARAPRHPSHRGPLARCV